MMILNNNKNGQYLSKLHRDILLIMDEVHRICTTHHLKYYLCAGSLLGAIRHNGFIPWDDDLDIMMPRSDYEKFITLSSSVLGDKFYLDWITTNPSYSRAFSKVCLKNTLFQENPGTNEKMNTEWGIFIDIFPIDLTGEDINDISKRKYLFNKIRVMINGKKNLQAFSIFKRIVVVALPRSFLFYLLKKISTWKQSYISC